MKAFRKLLIIMPIFLFIHITLLAVHPPGNRPVVSDTTVHKQETNQKLVVLWTSGDREVALKMAFMYTFNAKNHGWWDEITLIIWGPSANLSSEDQEIKDNLKKMIDAGIEIVACKGCADMYGVTPVLEEIGVDVKYMGTPLTEYLKEGIKVLTL